MYSWCTRTEWLDDFFDFDWVFGERGCFRTYDEARADAVKHGYDNADIMVIHSF